MAKAKTILPLVSEDALQSSLTKSGRPSVCRFFLLCRSGIIRTECAAADLRPIASFALLMRSVIGGDDFYPSRKTNISTRGSRNRTIINRLTQNCSHLGAILFGAFNSRCLPISCNGQLRTDGERMKTRRKARTGTCPHRGAESVRETAGSLP